MGAYAEDLADEMRSHTGQNLHVMSPLSHFAHLSKFGAAEINSFAWHALFSSMFRFVMQRCQQTVGQFHVCLFRRRRTAIKARRS